MARYSKNDFVKMIYAKLNGGSYSVGLHGVAKERCKDITGKEDSEAVIDILENGLTIYSSRSINGTVYPCGRIDDKEDLKEVVDNLKGYNYNDSEYYVLVAIPTVIKDSKGHSIYVGKPNLNSEYKKYFNTTGYEVTSLADSVVLTDIKNGNQKISNEFILGVYKKLPDGSVEFIENPNHVSKRGGKVSDELFEIIDNNLLPALINIDELATLLTKEELTEDDIKNLKVFYDKFNEVIKNTISDVSIKLAPILETIKQRLNESKIVKPTTEDINILLKEEERKDYSKIYEGLEGEELFRKELEVIYDMKVDYFHTESGKLIVHSDVPGEAEEFMRLFNDRGFIDRVFKYGNSFEIRNMALSMLDVTGDDILKDEDIYLKLFKYSYYALENYNERKLLTRDMLVKCAETSSFNQDTLYKLPEEYSEDYDLIVKFIENSNFDNFGFYTPYGESNLAYPSIGIGIRSNPEFYDKLNSKIEEINNTGERRYPYFDKEKEISLVKGRSR